MTLEAMLRRLGCPSGIHGQRCRHVYSRFRLTPDLRQSEVVQLEIQHMPFSLAENIADVLTAALLPPKVVDQGLLRLWHWE